MNKKFINLLLASVLTVGSAQVFTSCKDNEADFQKEVLYEYESLAARVAQNERDIQTLNDVTLPELERQLRSELTTEKGKLNTRIDSLNSALATEIGNVNKALKDSVNNLSGWIKNLDDSTKNSITNLWTAIKNNGGIIAGLDSIHAADIARVDSVLSLHSGNIAALNDSIGNHAAKIIDLETKIAVVDSLANDTKNALNALTTTVGNLGTTLGNLGTTVGDLGTTVGDLGTTLVELSTTVEDNGTRLETAENALLEVQKIIDTLLPTEEFNKYMEATDGRLALLEKFRDNWETILPEMQQNAAEAYALANINAASIEATNNMIEELKESHASNASLIQGLQMKIDGILAQLENVATLDDLNEVASYLQNQARNYYQQSIGYTNLMIEQVLGQMATQIADMKNSLTNDFNAQILSVTNFQTQLDQRLTTLQAKVDGMEGNLQEYLQAELEAAIAEISGTIGDVSGSVEEIQGNIQTINLSITDLNDGVKDLKDRVKAIEKKLSTLTGRVDEIARRISNIVIQGTDSPVFGSVRLPLGIQSNMLVAYAGFVANGGGYTEFPLVAETAGTYDGEEYNILTAAEAKALGIEGYTDNAVVVPVERVEGVIMNKASDKKSGLLGRVYATINPSKVDVDNFTFNLVNSRGQKIANELTFKPSDELLTFGYTRATSPNGFYSAEATINTDDEAAMNSVRFHFNDKLKSTVKDILKAPRANANANTVVKLASAVYDQVNGFLPAIGIEASWNDSEKGTMTVTSNYAIATAVANPLSFKTLLDYKPGRHIPNLLPQLDKIKDKFNATFDEMTGNLKITLYDPNDPNSGFHINTPTGGWVTKPEININISLDGLHIDNPDPVVIAPIIDEETGRVIYEGDTIPIDISSSIEELLGELQNKLNTQFKDQLGGIGDSFDGINDQLDSVISSISGEVNDLLSSMQTEIDTTINSVLSDIKNKVNGVFDNATLNGLIKRMDAVINKLNDMMDNANYYLQPALFYINDGSYGRISAHPGMPSVMVVSNDNAGITLVPTTLTYETVVPVYEKYVAVTKVWENGDPTKANKVSVAKEANGNTDMGSNMNKVLDGSVRRVALKLKKGYTYEVFYQAIDFSGYVSGRKYYICVK